MKKVVSGLAAVLLSLSLWAQLQFKNLDEVLDYADKNSLAAKAAQLNEQLIAKDEQLYRSTLLPGSTWPAALITTLLFLPWWCPTN
jgi:hypothetical protein